MIDQNKLQKLGAWYYLKLSAYRFVSKAAKKPTLCRVRLIGFKNDLFIRAGTSDYDCFHLIFIQEEYKDVVAIFKDRISYFIDCGLNVGYASRYFLEHMPNLKIIGFEPEKSNIECARLNLQYFPNQTQITQEAIWSKTTHVRIIQSDFGNGGNWSFAVEETEPGPDSISTCDLNYVLSQIPSDKIFVKMDIEGSETEVLSKNNSWMDKLTAIAVELHNKEAKHAFENIKNQYGLTFNGVFGEMHVLSR